MRDSLLRQYDKCMIDYREWFKSATGRRVTAEEVAQILNVSRATATRRLTEGLDPGDVIKLSRTLGVNPVMALVDLDHLTHKEALDFLDGEGQLVETADEGYLALVLAQRLNPISKINQVNEIALRRSNRNSLGVHPLSDDEIAADLREANQMPSAAHDADDSTEYTEPELP